ncbi:hypothetical protein BRADI_1g46682v3 [Brachypodium distachyon]|uniref:Uncharacterized protein n=1 Tax=Brachypodium distachyon TaxID=15368 RepID=A0A2K2DPT0_BRADI|nr:hypothetical protein BRADI_1g46682v3 [Brachypodium distachyon]
MSTRGSRWRRIRGGPMWLGRLSVRVRSLRLLLVRASAFSKTGGRFWSRRSARHSRRMHQRELAPLGGNHCYSWAIKPAVGHSGGMLIAAREDLFDHIASDVGEFFTNMVVKDKNSSA